MHPQFLISDRDKGLVPAAAALSTIENHFLCFRHLMENFNRQFRSKSLKSAAWALALAVNEGEFAKKAAILKRMNPAAEAWLMNAGKDKWSLCYSPSPRFGALTSNNVESVNGALKAIRKLPIIDCLMAIERDVGSRWVPNSAAVSKWGTLTHRTATRIGNVLALNSSFQVTQHSESAFVVTDYVKPGEPPPEYAVQLFDSCTVCSCGYPKDIRAPCIHALVCLRKVDKQGAVNRYFDRTWTTDAYKRAYTSDDERCMSPPVLKEMLTPCDCAPPKITKRRGRPKKHRRRESQHATLALSKKKGRK